MKLAAAIVALSAGWAACTPSSPRLPVRFFEDSTDLGGVGWLGEQAEETGVRLELSGLHPIDDRIAFLFGGLQVPAGTLRSVLLRTADGGATWEEVMAPVPGSEVLHLAFANGSRGWALAAWTVEGPGEVVLYRSDSAGRTWTKLADIPSGTWGYPVSMTFTDPSRGEIGLSYDAGGDDSTGVELLSTADGGRTWRTARRLPAKENEAREAPRVVTAVGHDGSAWQLDLGAFGAPSVVIRRRAPAQGEWTLKSTLPTRFSYRGGRVLAASDR